MRTRLLVFVAMLALGAAGAGAVAQRDGREPRATQGPTSGDEMMPPFDPRYFLGEWEIEWNPPETGLVSPGKWTGTETVTHVNSRYLKIAIAMENEDGATMRGDGIMFYEFGLNGQSIARFVSYAAGFSILQHGPLGGDLGGYYSTFWEAPEITHDDHTFVLKGRSYFVSPAAYRIDQQISIDDEDFVNFGIMWLTKNIETPAGPP